MTDKFRHLNFIGKVADKDIEYVNKKDRQYGASWKQRGGVGAFMMLARKWDRIENMLGDKLGVVGASGTSGQYNILRALEIQGPDGEDGTILAEIRDLRRYLLLVEAEYEAYLAESGLIVTVYTEIGVPLRSESTKARHSWIGEYVKFTPHCTGLSEGHKELLGEVLEDEADVLKVQAGPTLSDVYHIPKNTAMLTTKPGIDNDDMNKRLVPRHVDDTPKTDSNRHAVNEDHDHKTEWKTAGPNRPPYKLLITKDLYEKLSEQRRSFYILTGENAQLDRRKFPTLCEGLTRFKRTLTSAEWDQLPVWNAELYDLFEGKLYELKAPFNGPLWAAVG